MKTVDADTSGKQLAEILRTRKSNNVLNAFTGVEYRDDLFKGGDANRILVASLGGFCSAIELRLQGCYPAIIPNSREAIVNASGAWLWSPVVLKLQQCFFLMIWPYRLGAFNDFLADDLTNKEFLVYGNVG